MKLNKARNINENKLNLMKYNSIKFKNVRDGCWQFERFNNLRTFKRNLIFNFSKDVEKNIHWKISHVNNQACICLTFSLKLILVSCHILFLSHR